MAPAYDDAYPFSEGLAPVELGGKMGYIDVTGKLVIPLRFHITFHKHNFAVASFSLQVTLLASKSDEGRWQGPAISLPCWLGLTLSRYRLRLFHLVQVHWIP